MLIDRSIGVVWLVLFWTGSNTSCWRSRMNGASSEWVSARQKESIDPGAFVLFVWIGGDGGAFSLFPYRLWQTKYFQPKTKKFEIEQKNLEKWNAQKKSAVWIEWWRLQFDLVDSLAKVTITPTRVKFFAYFTHILLLMTDRSNERTNEQKSIRIMWRLIIKGHRER